jgi:hypothetical protein
MDIKKFPNPKLNLPKELRDSTEETVKTSFSGVENYIDSVGKYIYTEINLDYLPSDPKHIHAWIQRIVSASVLRSLYLRNAFVEMFNARNTVGIFLALKAWMEVVGFLASILHLLESNLSSDEIFKRLEPYILGNRGKGGLRVGTTDAVGVATMIEKADKYIEKMGKEENALKNNGDADTFFTDFYDIASNPTHPSFDAHEVVGDLVEEGIWKAKTPDEVKNGISEGIPGYGGLLSSALFVENICNKIYKNEKSHYEQLDSTKYFDYEKITLKDQVGGMKLPGGFAIGPMFYSKDGKTASATIGPAIIAFDFGMTNSLNLLNRDDIADNFQSVFNSEVENLVSEMLIYFQNRLKVISKTSGQFNSVQRCISEYSKYNIDLNKLCNTKFLLAVDSVRGRKHHSDRRYDADYSIDGVSYDTIEKLKQLNRLVNKEIHAINDSLSESHKDYEVKVSQTPNSTSIEFISENHAFDLTRGGKVVSKNKESK